MPFLAFLIDPIQALEIPLVASILNSYDLGDVDDLRWKFTVLFAVAAIFSGLLRLGLVTATARFVFAIGHEYGAEVVRLALYQPYRVHISTNSSDIIGGLNKIENIIFIIYGLLNAATAILISICIFVTLVIISPEFTTVTIIVLGGSYAALMRIMKKRLANNAEIISKAMNERIKITQESLGSIRDILLDHAQQYFVNRFNKMDREFRQAQASNLIIAPSPRFVVEALGMVVIAGFAYMSVSTNGDLTTVIPVIGAMALGAQRLLPLIQLIYIGMVNLRGQEQLVFDVVELLEQSADEESYSNLTPLKFNHSIDFQSVYFRFQEDTNMVLEELSFSIAKGQRVGFLGPTGSGKSTTMDLMMGLLTGVPTHKIVMSILLCALKKSKLWYQINSTKR